jgi:4-hydroxy-tetrahydrodipicolinate reductase
MGRMLEQAAREANDVDIVAIVGQEPTAEVYAELLSLPGAFDCLIDFSHRNNTEAVMRFAQEAGKPVVMAVTGLDAHQEAVVKAAAQNIPVVYSQNLSIGINLLLDVVRHLGQALGADYDVEIIEKHHNQKEDAPSGTANMLLAAIDSSGEKEVVHGRNGLRKRRRQEIGMHAVRGGTIVGEHLVLFAGHDEMIEIKHTALSKRLFAEGALRAARFVVKQQPAGLYTMQQVIANT